MYQDKNVASLFKKADELGYEEDNTIAGAWWHFASGPNWLGTMAGQRPSITREYWSWPIYDVKDANTKIRIWRNPDVWDEPARWAGIPEFKSSTSKKPVTIPYNHEWNVGKGTDQGILIKDGDNYYSVLNLRPIMPWNYPGILLKTFTWFPFGSASISNEDWVCDGFDLSTPENAGKIQGCGSGNIPKHVGIVTADMLLNGVDQALSMVVANSQMGKDAVFRYPGTRVEHKDVKARRKGQPAAQLMPEGNDPKMIPCGSRLVLNKSYREIDEWSKTKPEAMQKAAYNLAVGLKEYGFVTKETGNGEAQIECEGTLNRKAKEKFRQAGLLKDSDFKFILEGLFTGPDDLKVVKQP